MKGPTTRQWKVVGYNVVLAFLLSKYKSSVMIVGTFKKGWRQRCQEDIKPLYALQNIKKQVVIPDFFPDACPLF